MLANFEELVFKCPNETSRSHIREAIRCYDAGTYRSAIVASYVAVCFDLIEKTKFLAFEGDGEAKILIADLEKLQEKLANNDPAAIPGLLKFERELPNIFLKKFEFFGAIEYDDIQRLITDRNRCAHPTFLHSEDPYQPSAEVARLHIRNALDLVLTQAPKQGKSALASLRTIITSASFPDDDQEVLNRLELTSLKNGRVTLIRNFIDDACFGISTPSSPYFQNFSAIRSAEAVVKMHPAIAFPRYCANINKLLVDTDPNATKYGSLMALRSPDVSNILNAAARPILRAFVTAPVGAFKITSAQRALKIDWLKDHAKLEIGKLNSGQIKKLRGKPEPETLNRSVDLISSVGSYAKANEVCDDLSYLAKYMSESQIEQILEAADLGKADLRGAYGFDSLLRNIASENPIGKDGIIKMLKKHNLSEPTWSDGTDLEG